MMSYWILALALPLLLQAAPSYVRLLPQDCHEIYRSGENRSGVYTIYPEEEAPVQVYCDMGCKEDSFRGWTVFQRRMDGSVNFYRPWEQYKNGFGNKSGEYWMGLDSLYSMTKNKRYELRVDLEGFDGAKVYAEYTYFSIGDEDTSYTLQVGGFMDGGAGDSLYYHNGARFSTFDRENSYYHYYYDYYYYYYNYYYSCARESLGAFWYFGCHLTNPNGIYMWTVDWNNYGKAVSWYSWRGLEYNLKSITMKIRPAP
ncbi:microfibril-associated glycoprotein 4-like [Trichomycterus rosablanca]|uniref:microfibril-associated glycoprotein 4-like n=1 Tax=Trichomycterus rosablanca TaxID=2290929 RepID=UPI002F35D488